MDNKQPLKFTLGAAIRQERVSASDEDMAAVNAHTLNPLTADKVAIFRMDLCNDQIDRHVSRFPTDELKAINEMIVGKPLMELHDMPSQGLFGSTRGSQPVGTFFRSQLAQEDGKLNVRSDVFMLRDAGDDNLIAKIDAGVAKGTSISFALDRPECSACGCDIRDCAHMPGEDVDGKLCHVILKEITDVFEGSIVPLGSQGTEFVEARGADDEGKPVLPLKDAIRQARNTSDLCDYISPDFAKNSKIPKILAERQKAVEQFEVKVMRECGIDTEGHPGVETDDELRTSVQESLESVRAIPSEIYKLV